ncbi:MAG: redox-sensing transcriptional repressor Rex [Firmicutes bacterium]|nr:redox-sensing transcriptional repressor Rex [Bacillota bacterium]
MDERRRIPQATVRRLPVYLRDLTEAAAHGVTVTSSSEMAARTGISSEQIRKDLAYFGAFGTRGVGYDTRLLAAEIRRILGIERRVGVALVGAGHLGFALARYSRQEHADVAITMVFDRHPKVVGTRIGDLTVLPVEEMEERVREAGIRMAVIAVPGEEAPGVLAALARAGVEAVLNFSPVALSAPGVHVQHIDLTLELQSLAFFTSLRQMAGAAVAEERA